MRVRFLAGAVCAGFLAAAFALPAAANPNDPEGRFPFGGFFSGRGGGSSVGRTTVSYPGS